jgi:putative transposase
MRKNPLASNEVYHVFTKSIDNFITFKDESDFTRAIETIKFYRYGKVPISFSTYLKTKNKKIFSLKYELDINNSVVEIIAYCIMPTHLHLILKQLVDNGISIFIKNVLDSYTRYFNNKYSRRGTLWQSRFKSVYVESNEQLLHLTRYIHLNPTTAGLVKNPEDWTYSSYLEYLNKSNNKICNYEEYLDMDIKDYKKFVDDRKDYQKELGLIKHLAFDQ